MRDIIALKCESCGEINYTITKNKRLHPEKFEVNKYCRRERKHTKHKESRDTIKN